MSGFKAGSGRTGPSRPRPEAARGRKQAGGGQKSGANEKSRGRKRSPGHARPRAKVNAGTVVQGGRLWRRRRWVFVPLFVVAAVVAAGLYALTQVPLPAAKPLAQTTFVYDSTGHVLASFSEQNRVNVTLKQVAPIAVDAVVSTEDRHFFTEGALNPISILRAAINDVSGSGSLQGASTITQQYVKQTYLSSQRTVSRKIKEAALAIRVSRTESKATILDNYLNTIYWGRGAYGIEAASRSYFDVDASQLDLPEAALLAGLIREPDLADPSRDPAIARQNQRDSLLALVRDRRITEAQAAAAAAVPLSDYVKPPTSRTENGEEAYFIEAVREQLIAKYGAAEVDEGGLRVSTTLDPTLQSRAYSAIYGPERLDPAGGSPSGALVALDDNGEVRALVGGQDYFTSSVDLALGSAGGGGGRQAGSTFKAFMLAELLKLGYSPESVFPAPPEVVVPHGNSNGTAWVVKNFAGESAPSPQLSLVDATAYSVNTVYAQVVDRLGATNLDSMAAQLGIRPAELGDYPSEVLGSDEVSPLEMTAAFATFAAGGVYHSPLFVTRVTNSNGRNLPLPVPAVSRQVLTIQQAAEENYILQQVVLRGTGTRAGAVGSEVAGKTGTTDNSANAWFVGYTPNLTASVWMGYANSFRPMYGVQGGTVPAELWQGFMASAISAEPQWAGSFPSVSSLSGSVLSPPPASTLEFPLGMGTTTTTSTSTTVPGSTTTTSTPGKHATTTTTTVAPSTTTSTTHPKSG